MRKLTYLALSLIAASVAHFEAATAQQSVPTGGPRSQPFTTTPSNQAPLVFGMEVGDVSRALGEPLTYVSGPAGDETYLAIRNLGGSGLFNHNDRLYLQFRKGRLAGWKGDWGHNWMWR